MTPQAALSQQETKPSGVPLHPAEIIGLAAIARQGFAGIDLMPLWQKLANRVTQNPADTGALLDLSMIELIVGRRANRLSFQAQALTQQRIYRLPAPSAVEAPLRLLAFMAPGDFMANTPVEFLLEQSAVQLDILYVLPHEPLPAFIPDHDIAIVAIAESPENRAHLETMAKIAETWPVPILNPAARIARLTRDGAWQLLAGAAGLAMARNARIDRSTLDAVATGKQGLDRSLPGAALPIIVRPLGSHGGQGLARIESEAELRAYLG